MDTLKSQNILNPQQQSIIEASSKDAVLDVSAFDEGQVYLLTKNGFLDAEGKLTREVVQHSDAFLVELDDRDKHTPDIMEMQDLPLIFLKDVSKNELKDGEQPVYPHHGESNDIFFAAKHYLGDRKFDSCIECFSGAGHIGIKLANSSLLEDDATISGLDINPRALSLSETNAALNNCDIEYFQGNLMKGDLAKLPAAQKEGNKLFVGNAPFALSPPKTELAVLRDGGEDGLEKTMAFVQSSLDVAKSEDSIVGVAYTRIDNQGEFEFEQRLKVLQDKGFKFEYRVEPVEGAKLWRGYNGKKEQNNPMDLDMMVAKGEQGTELYEKYVKMAEAYKAEGWNELAYVRYVIDIPKSDMGSEIEGLRRKMEDISVI